MKTSKVKISPSHVKLENVILQQYPVRCEHASALTVSVQCLQAVITKISQMTAWLDMPIKHLLTSILMTGEIAWYNPGNSKAIGYINITFAMSSTFCQLNLINIGEPSLVSAYLHITWKSRLVDINLEDQEICDIAQTVIQQMLKMSTILQWSVHNILISAGNFSRLHTGDGQTW